MKFTAIKVNNIQYLADISKKFNIINHYHQYMVTFTELNSNHLLTIPVNQIQVFTDFSND